MILLVKCLFCQRRELQGDFEIERKLRFKKSRCALVELVVEIQTKILIKTELRRIIAVEV